MVQVHHSAPKKGIKMKRIIGLIIVGVFVTELCALLEGARYINFNFLVPTILSHFI